jgi:ankyrin repeat protein
LDELLQGGETNNSDYLIDDPVVVLLETIKKAVSKTKVRVLFISRDETNIRESLRIDGAWHPVEYRISVDDVRVDIESFSKSIVDKKLSNKPEVMKAEISQQMADRCNGQFLWLRLQENSISRGKNKKQLEKAINETPAGLDRLYDRNWNKILDYPESERARAFSLLRWAAFSLRPLTIFEITEALLISPSEDLDMEDMPDEVDDDYVDSEIFRLCGSLIEIRSSSPESKLGDRTIHMTHFTIKEYFIRRMTNQGGVLSSNPQVHNGILARLCLHYIESDCVWEKSSATNAHWGVFRDYAAGNWHHHVRLCVQDPELVSHVDAFFASASRNWHEWGKWVDLQQVEFHKDDAISRDDLEKTKQRILDDLKTKTSASFSPLYYATLLGLEETVIHLLGLKRYDVNEMGHFGNTPLAIASGHGSLAIATKLIEEGAILSAKNQRECTPLCVAATNNHAEVVNLILQHDPDILVSELEGSTPLQNAAQAGSLESLRLLLAAGAGVNIATKKGATPLYFAALRGHTAIAKELLNHGADITLQDVKGWNALHNAAEKGHLEIFYLLIEKGADITVRDAEGWTALHWAAYGRSFSTAEALISLGADLTIQDHGGWTPLHHAADRGCLNIVQLLLKNGADPTVQDTNGWTPLHWATFGEHLAVIELLIANGADLTIKDNAGGTALHHAAGKDYLSTVELLFKHGAVATVLDSGGWSALHWAAFNGKYSTVKCLIDHGTDPAVKDEDGWTGLDWAARKGHTSILKLFLEHGVSPTNPDSHGWTALHYAALNGQFSTASILVDNGADFEAVDDSGWTALHHASDRGRLNIVQLLLDKRANIEARDSDGWTALHWASSNGRTEVVKVLLQHGADVSVKDRSSGATPLIIAAEGCHSKVVKILLESGSDVNALGYNQKTALLAAARTGLTDAIRVLVDHGSDIEARGRHGRTPLFVASWYGHRETVDILLSCSADVNATDRYGGTPLSAAVKWGHEGVVEALLNSPSICITLPDCLGKTISYWIAKSGKTKIQELVTEHALKKGLEIPKEDLNVEPYGETDMDHRCYICVRPLDEKTWYCCAVCDGGSFLDLDVCSQCFAGGFGCLEKSHALVEIEMRGGTRVERKAMVNDVTNS